MSFHDNKSSSNSQISDASSPEKYEQMLLEKATLIGQNFYADADYGSDTPESEHSEEGQRIK